MGAHVCSVAKSCPVLCDPMNCSLPGSSVHGIFQARIGKNTGVGCHFLLPGIFPTQESNPRLLHWQANSLPPRKPCFTWEVFIKCSVVLGVCNRMTLKGWAGALCVCPPHSAWDTFILKNYSLFIWNSNLTSCTSICWTWGTWTCGLWILAAGWLGCGLQFSIHFTSSPLLTSASHSHLELCSVQSTFSHHSRG